MAQVFPLNIEDLTAADGRPTLVGTLAALPEPWTLLRDRHIAAESAESVQVVLVHPEIGVALVDEAPRDPTPQADALRAYLEGQHFGSYFPGDLPIVALSVAPEDFAASGERLAAAFDAAPRLSIADRDWADAVIELLLVPDDLAMAPLGPGPVPAESEPALVHVSSEWADEPPEAPGIPLERRIGPAMDPGEIPMPLMVDWPFATSYRPKRRWGRAVAAAALGIVVLGGAGFAAWQFDEEAPPSTDSPQAQVEIPLPRPSVANRSAENSPPAQKLPPVPPGPPVVLAQKPLVPLPPAPPTPTRVEPLPQVAAAPPPPANTPPPAKTAAASPSQTAPAAPTPPATAAATPVPATPQPAPPAPAQTAAAPPPSAPPAQQTAAAQPHPPTQTAATEPPPAPKLPPHRAAAAAKPKPPPRVAKAEPAPPRPAPPREPGPPGRTRPQEGPPIDAADLPPLDDAPAAKPQPPVQPPVETAGIASPPPAVASPPPAAALGPPVPLRALPTSGSTAATDPTPRECRPYTSNTTLTGRGAAVQGIACRGPDGQWRLVSEVPIR